MVKRPNALLLSLESLLQKESSELTLRTLVHALSGRGYPVLMIILSFPFCIPVSIPGLSTPFGLLLAFMGFRIALGKKLWWPAWLLDKKISPKSLHRAVQSFMKVVKFLQPILYTRLVTLTRNPFLHRMHGFTIALMALLLALPIPLPLTNTFAALPIVFISLGLLEDDGLFIILGYILAVICLIFFAGLLYLGKEGVGYFINNWT